MTERITRPRARRLFGISVAAALLASLVRVTAVSAAGEGTTFAVQPGGAITGGLAFPQQPTVNAVNNSGPQSGVVITLSIRPTTGTAGATLSCAGGNSKTTNGSGDAVFTGCEIDKAGQNYQLRAVASGFPNQNSAMFDVGVGPADHLVFTQYPGATTPALLAPQPAVTTVDAGGNVVTTASNAVTLSINKNAGTFACTGGLSTTAVNGVATFIGCTQTMQANSYHLTATATPGSITSAVGSDFDISSGPAAKLLLCWGTALPCVTTPPTTITGGTAFPVNPVIRIADASGNTVTTSTANVQLSILAGAPLTGGPGTLTCDQTANTKAAVAGVAPFTNCRIDKVGTGYKLTATSGALTAPTNQMAFNVAVGAPAKLIFMAQPPLQSTAGQPFATAMQVGIADAGGNAVTAGITATISLGIANNPGGGALTCQGGTNATTTIGVAVFTGCSITKQGIGYTLSATPIATAPITVLSGTTSNAFTILAPAASISLTPSSEVITWGQDVSFTIQFGVNGAGKTFTLQVSKDNVNFSNISGATLTTDANGTASFTYGPSDNRYYRVSFAGSGDLQAGFSPTVRVVVRQTNQLRPTASNGYKPIVSGTVIVFQSTIRPNRPELPQGVAHFVVYRVLPGPDQKVLDQMIPVNRSNGVASLSITFNTPGLYYVRSEAVPTPFNANSGWSELHRYQVTG
jgi:hypothetical protein